MRLICGVLAFAVVFLLIAVFSRGVAATYEWSNPFVFGDNNTEMRADWQARVEQRVIIRIPSRASSPVSTPSSGSQKPAQYKEVKIGKCLMMDRLIASRPGPKNSLELATRDGIFIRAYLDDSCFAREFYAGAYMERPADGKLCVKRDFVHARTGAKCEINKFRVLQPI
jgi:hypothetical protein